MAAKSKAKAQPKRGGARTGSGRKPKAIRELQEAVTLPLIQPQAGTGTDTKSAAEYALDLFNKTMRDAGKGLELRLDCAREVLNRTIGKPRVAEPQKPAGEEDEQVHIYMPDNGRDLCSAEAV